MGLLPIVSRELGLAAARPGTYRIRFWSGVVTSVLTLAMVLSGAPSNAALGGKIFGVLSVLAFAYVLLSGVRCTADALSQEKRDGTLGLLFLTDLKAYDVILGKMVVNSIDAAYAVVAILPMLGIPLILGAVTGTQFWEMNLLLLITLFFSLALGLLVSTFGHSERAVTLNTLFLALAITFGLPLLWWPLSLMVTSPWLERVLLGPSPAYAARIILARGLGSPNGELWISLCLISGLGTGCLVWATLLLPRVFQEGESTRAISSWRDRFRRWRFCDPKFRGFQDGHWVERQPFLWLLSRDRLSRTTVHILTGALIAFAVIAPGLMNARRMGETVVVFGSFGLHCLVKLLVSADVTRRLNDDKRSGALELLLATPLPVAQILESQVLSTRTFFLIPAILLGLLNFGVVAGSAVPISELATMFLGGAVILGFDVYAIIWVGMLNALREARYARAVLRTLGWVLVPPWIVFFLVMTGIQPGRSGQGLFFFGWFLAAGGYDLWLAGRAKRELFWRFRSWAANDHRPVRLLVSSERSGRCSALIR